MEKTLPTLTALLKGKTVSKAPVWLMRQAGRYLPEYRKLRVQAPSFLDFCLTPSLAVEATLQPLRRFDLDAAIVFADILLVPFGLGQELSFREGEGPLLPPLMEEGLFRLSWEQGRITPILETMGAVRAALPLDKALIGFAGSPWTVACYMIDGHGRGGFEKARQRQAAQDDFCLRLFDRIHEATFDYLSAQIEAGADVLQLFDSHAGLLCGEDFNRWVIQPTKRLVIALKEKYPETPIIGFPRGATAADCERYVLETGVDALGLDQGQSLEVMEAKFKGKTVLQGNIDPTLLVRGGTELTEAVRKVTARFGLRHIYNLGHGILPETPPEYVALFIRAVREGTNER